MATTKKPVAKRASTKKAPAKKAVASRASTAKPKAAVASKSVKRTTNKRSTKKNNTQLRSFHVAKDQPPFTTFKITRQTVYWIILVSFIVFAQLWIIKLQVDVANLIEIQQSELLNNL